MTVITDLPTEILLHIFRCYIETEKQENLMENVANVCLDWKNICLNRYLWTKYDGTLSFEEMMTLCETGCLSNTKELIMSSISSLKNVDEDKLFSAVKNVEAISFSNVNQLSKNTLSIVADNCEKLKEIQIGKLCKKTLKLLWLNYKMFGTFFAARGCGIVKINLSYCNIGNFSLFIHCISDCCPNLEYLLLTNLHIAGAFPTKYFQMHCFKLKELHLDHSISITCNSHTSGFPDLEAFTYIDSEGHRITDKDLKCILFNSSKLKFLNLTNCDISATVLCSLPACSVECLYIARSKICNTNALRDVFKKWNHSLKEVDISYGANSVVNAGVYTLVKVPTQSPLEYLNVSFTKVFGFVVEEILQNCTRLEVLKLVGCRNLGRGMKKTYNGKKEFADLSTKLKTFNSSQPQSVEAIDEVIDMTLG